MMYIYKCECGREIHRCEKCGEGLKPPVTAPEAENMILRHGLQVVEKLLRKNEYQAAKRTIANMLNREEGWE